MKNKHLTYGKKTLSVFLAVMMLLTSWVFFPGMFGMEANALDAGTSVAEYNKQILNGLNTSTIDTSIATTYYQFNVYGKMDSGSDQNTEANRNELYRNVIWHNGHVKDVNTGSYFTGVENAEQNVSVMYPSMTLKYDGTTAPRFGLLLQGDSKSGAQVRFERAWIDSGANGLSFNPNYWKGIAAEDSNFFYIMKGAGEGPYVAINSSDTGYRFNARKNGQWEFVATTLEFKEAMGSTEWVRTISPTWKFTGGKSGSTKTFTGTNTSTINVMNFKGYEDYIKTTMANHKQILINNAGKYSAAAIRDYVNAANEIRNLNPKSYASNPTSWASQMSSKVSAYETAYNKLINGNANRTAEVSFENLFSFTDWAASNSPSYDSSKGEVVLENGKTVKIYKSGSGGELTTSSSYPNNHDASRYSIPVIGNKQYTVRFNITSSVSGSVNSEVFVFWYDANNNPVKSTTSTNTFNNQGFSGDGVKTVTFTAPSSAVKAEIRFDNDCATSASTIRFNDIAFYPAEQAAIVEPETWTTRPYLNTSFKLGATLSGTLAVPVRPNYEFVGWYYDQDRNGLKDNNDPQVTDATGKVINGVTLNDSINLISVWKSLPMDIGFDNIFSLADWSKTGSTSVSGTGVGSATYDLTAGTITVESTSGGEVYTNYGSGSNQYHIDVDPETEYVFETDISVNSGTAQMFVFFYDAEGNGLAGSVYNGATQTSPHIGIYPASGTKDITFTTPEKCDYIAFRVGATQVGTVATFSNIGFYKKDAYDAYAKDYTVIRQAFYIGDTDALTYKPTREGYTFDKWVDGKGNTVTSVEGFKTSDTVYAQWIQLFTVTFKNYDGSVINTVTVAPGGAAEAPATPSRKADENYEYTFKDWDKDFSNVQSDLEVTAVFTENEHTGITYSDAGAATCTTPGKIRKYCTTCNYAWNNGNAYVDENGEFLPALGHTFERATPTYKVVINTSTGNKDTDLHTIKCNECDATTTQVHNFKEDGSHPASTATCITPGETYYICACLQTKTEVGEINPSNHVKTEIKDALAAECEKDGYTGDKWCTDCNTKLEVGTTIEALKHAYTNYVPNGDATCTADGTKTAVCDNGCGKKDTVKDTGSMIDHSFTTYVPNGDAKCGIDGTKTAECDYNCGETDTVTDTGSALEHKFDGDYVSNNNGTHVQKCTNKDCTATGNEKTCEYGAWTTDNAETHSHTCTDCGYTPDAQAHDWNAWSTVGGTGTSEATQTRTCKVCGKVENTSCNYVVETHREANCEAAEITTYRCTDCKHGYTVIGKAPIGHNFTADAGVKNRGNGTHSFYCANECGEYGFGTTKNSSVPCSEWNYLNTEAGKHTAECKDCGYKKAEDCTGGLATCTDKAVCDYCKEAYGTTADHIYTGSEKYLYKATDATCIANETYYYYCIGCEQTADGVGTYEKPDTKTEHDYTCTDEYLYKATEAECEVNETYYAYCSNPDCKKSSEDAANTYEKDGTALTHNYDGTIVNCNDDGTHTITCANTNSDNWTCDSTITANCVDVALSTGGEEATCLSQGYTSYQCTLCGYNWNDNYTPALGHDYNEMNLNNADYVVENANCEHGTIYWYGCTRCDANAKNEKDTDKYTDLTFENTNDKRAHEWQNKVDSKYLVSEATCFDAAWYYTSCKYEDCAKSSEEVNGTGNGIKFQSGAPIDHEWTKVEDVKYIVKDADCENNATYYYECSKCKNSSEIYDNGSTWEKEGSKKEHDFDHDNDGVVGNEGDAGYAAAKAADCYSAGNYEYWHCEICEVYFKKADASEKYLGQSATVISQRKHKTKSLEYLAPTCKQDGHPAYEYCEHEGCTYNTLPAVIPDSYKATGHNFTGAYYCDTVNNYHAQYCINTNCDKVTLTDVDGNPYKVNAFGMVVDGEQIEYSVEYDELGDLTVEGGAACEFTYKAETKEGVHSHANSCVCGNNSTVIYADSETLVKTVAATCTAPGYEEHKCPDDDCGKTWKKNYVDKLGHDYSEVAVSNNDGKTHYYQCANGCGDKSRTENCSGGNATCLNKATCTKCNTEYGSTTDHSYVGPWEYQNDAKCGINGTEKNTCDICKTTQTREAANTALKHKMSDYGYDISGWKNKPTDFDASVIKAATCCDEGKSISYCVNCSEYKLKTEPADKSMHEWDDSKWTAVSGDCSTGITYVNYCIAENCGEAKYKTEAGEHSWELAQFIEPTCAKNGFRLWKCENCDFTMKEYYGFDGKLPEGFDNEQLAKNDNHVYYEAKVTVPATCTSDEYVIETCMNCRGEKVTYNEGTMLDHSIYTVKAEAADCENNGHKAYEKCADCSYSTLTDDMIISARGHKDEDGNDKCDECNKKLYATEDGQGSCGCICHKESGFMKLIYKILNFFWKLFKISKSCDCGDIHWGN